MRALEGFGETFVILGVAKDIAGSSNVARQNQRKMSLNASTRAPRGTDSPEINSNAFHDGHDIKEGQVSDLVRLLEQQRERLANA